MTSSGGDSRSYGTTAVGLASDFERQYLTVRQVADRLGLSPERVRAILRTRRLPVVRAGPMLLVPMSTVRVLEQTPRRPGRPRKGTPQRSDQNRRCRDT